jgi:hypothetical protein
MNGESTAAAEEPKPGTPEAMYGVQWNAAQCDFTSDMSRRWGGSLSSEFWTSNVRKVFQGSPLKKTSLGETTRPRKMVGKKTTKW